MNTTVARRVIEETLAGEEVDSYELLVNVVQNLLDQKMMTVGDLKFFIEDYLEKQ